MGGGEGEGVVVGGGVRLKKSELDERKRIKERLTRRLT
jgi:hypothetical protein